MYRKTTPTMKKYTPRLRCSTCESFVKRATASDRYIDPPTKIGWFCFPCKKFYYESDENGVSSE